MTTTTDYPTLNSRSIHVPELGVALNFTTMEVSSELAELIALEHLAERTRAINTQFALDVCGWLSVPSSHVITYHDWYSYTNQMLATLRGHSFRTQIIEAYGGADAESRNKIEDWLNGTQSNLSTLSSSFGSPSSFASSFARDVILLAPLGLPKHTMSTNALDYTGGPSLPQAVFQDLVDLGTSELALLNWLTVSGLLTSPQFRPAKRAYDIIENYDIPFAGSPALKTLTVGGVYGGVVTLLVTCTKMTLPTAESLAAQGQLDHAMACLFVGAVQAVVIVTAGLASGVLVNRYFNGDSLQKNPAPRVMESRPRTKKGQK